jgi:hypothetical protein
MEKEFVVVNVNEKGDFRKVPAIRVNDLTIVVTGGWLKTAKIMDEHCVDIDSVIDPEYVITRLKEEKMGADILYFAQKLPHVQPLFDYKYGLKSVAAIPIKSYADWWENTLSPKTRNSIRRSVKYGVIVKKAEVSDALIDGIVKIHNESPTRQGRHFWHYGRSAEDVKKDYSKFLDRSDILGAYFENELIGFAQLIYIGEIATILQFLPMYKHHQKYPANALVAGAVELCANKGLKYLVYARYSYDDNADSSLTSFKRHNGFEELLVPFYFIPLTIKGRIAVRFNLHLGFKRLIPKRIRKTMRKLRARILEKRTKEQIILTGDN